MMGAVSGLAERQWIKDTAGDFRFDTEETQIDGVEQGIKTNLLLSTLHSIYTKSLVLLSTKLRAMIRESLKGGGEAK
jgi:hypothetical protein